MFDLVSDLAVKPPLKPDSISLSPHHPNHTVQTTMERNRNSSNPRALAIAARLDRLARVSQSSTLALSALIYSDSIIGNQLTGKL